MNSKIFVLLAGIVLGIVMSGCQGSQKADSANADSTAVINSDSLQTEVEEIVNPLPTPFELTQTLNDIGARYVAEVLNSPAKVDKYFSEKEKALNLGVFGADLAYTTTYNKGQEMNLYLKSIKQLLDGIGVNIDYSALLDESMKEKYNNKDTLASIISNTFMSTYKYLVEKNSQELAVYMTAGMWAELMYIATHISTDTYNNIEIVKIIYNQSTSLEKLIKLMDENAAKADVAEFAKPFKELKAIYDATQGSLNKEQLIQITRKIEALRKSMVG